MGLDGILDVALTAQLGDVERYDNLSFLVGVVLPTGSVECMIEVSVGFLSSGGHGTR